MKNIFFIAIVIVALGYMFVMMKDRFDNIKETNQKIAQQKKPSN